MDKAYAPTTEVLMNLVGHGFVFEPTAVEHWVMGQGKAGLRFGATALMPSGHGWQAYKPIDELQNKNHFETMACTVFGTLNAYETLAAFLGFHDFPSNCSDRFSAILAGITPQGGSPQASAEAIRMNGVVPEETLPFSENIYDWEQFYSPNPMIPEYLALGRTITDKFTLGHEYVFNGVATDKPTLLKQALERGPVCVSMYAWKFDSAAQVYFKNPDDVDQHWIQLLDYAEGQYWLIFDQYSPFLKKVAWDTNFQTAKVYFLSRKDPNQQITLLTKIRDLCIQVVGLLTKLKQATGYAL